MTTEWFYIPAFVAAAAALGLAAVVLSKNHTSAFNRSVALMLGATAVMQMGNGLGLLDVSNALIWRRFALLGELAQPVSLLYAGLALMGGAEPGVISALRWRARAVAMLAALGGILAWSEHVYTSAYIDPVVMSIVLGSLGRVTYGFVLLALVLGLAQLEQVLRGSRDPLRYRLKFLLIGLGALGGYSVYQASRLLLLPIWQSEFVLVGVVVALTSTGLVAFGLGPKRLGKAKAQVYVSPQVAYESITYLIVGLYLLAVGVIAETIRYTGQPLSVVLSVVLVFAAAVGLAIVLLSRHARAALRGFIARHFYRSKYDFRTKWIEVTEAFQATSSVEAILDHFLHVLSMTFGADRISIWTRYEADGRFHQVRSANTEPAPPPLDDSHPVVCRLMVTDEPVQLDRDTREDRQIENAGDPFLETTHAVLCAPIRFEGELTAFVALSGELHRERYGTDDCDLLRAMAHHVGVLLSHARLADERRGAAELEALYRLSAFCLHDLKNLTAGLSLVIQNAAVHGEDPAFRKSAMQTVAGTVQKMTALMSKLSRESKPRGISEAVDVREVIAETLGSLNGDHAAPVQTAGERVAPVCIAREELQQVLMNVILNAQQAIQEGRLHAGGECGEIRITTEQVNERVVVTVADTGPGISAAGLPTLFQPFRTTKDGGLGIGLFQCKRILEAHRGRMRIDSQLGRGTRVRIELPIANE